MVSDNSSGSSGSCDIPQVAFWYLRHGETDYNARGLSQGAIDVALN